MSHVNISILSVCLVMVFVACESDNGSREQVAKPKEVKSVVKPTAKPAVDTAVSEIEKFIESQNVDKEKSNWRTSLSKPPQVQFDSEKSYFWNVETNRGRIKVQLMPDVAPMHVSSTVYLTKLGFYDGLIFHRVITGFMAQGGCPQGSGMGGPGYKYDGEYSPTVKHDKPGLLSMANAGPGTDGSQFFLTFVPTPHLDGRHTILGEIVDGMATLKALESRGSRGGQTTEKLVMEKCTISVQ